MGSFPRLTDLGSFPRLTGLIVYLVELFELDYFSVVFAVRGNAFLLVLQSSFCLVLST